MKDIYELKLNEVLVVAETPHNHPNPAQSTITRVPGGWIYKTYKSAQVGDQIALTSNAVFVPLNDEFKSKESVNFVEPTVM